MAAPASRLLSAQPMLAAAVNLGRVMLLMCRSSVAH
jgi:hypothetical protein